MRVAILVPRLTGGGAEFVASQWAAFLAQQGHEVTVLATHQDGDAPAGTALVKLTASSFPARVEALRGHLASTHYDVLLALMPHWNVLALLATLLSPAERRPAVVISGRNVESVLQPTQGLSYRVETALARLLYPLADAYIAVSHPVAAEAVSKYRLDINRVWVVPNPSTAATATSTSRPARRWDRSRPGTVTLTVPARLVPQKRAPLAVETAAVLTSQYGIAASVEFFGDGPEASTAERTAARLGVPVHFWGWVPRWFDQAAADSVVLLPSSAEGCPNVLLQAASVGIASVASSRALGVADAVVPNVTGVLCMGSSPEDYAAAVVKAMQIAPVHAPEWLARFSIAESGAELVHVLQSARANSKRAVSRAEPATVDAGARQ